MRLKLFVGLAVAVVFGCAAYSALAQSAPAATERRRPIAIGGGISYYDPPTNKSMHLIGETVWVDFPVPRMPSVLHGLGIEAEARDLDLHKPSGYSKTRQDSGEGGVIYTYRHYSKIQPYGKFLIGYGNLDQEGYLGNSTVAVKWHDSRTIKEFGGGLDYPILHRLWLRGDYEYQIWPDMKYHTVNGVVGIPDGSKHAQGFTVGAMYRFGSR
jgi:hypothetical protein